MRDVVVAGPAPKPTIHCGLCGGSAAIELVGGVLPDSPAGWSTVTIDQRGQVMRTTRACPACTSAVKVLLAQLRTTR